MDTKKAFYMLLAMLSAGIVAVYGASETGMLGQSANPADGDLAAVGGPARDMEKKGLPRVVSPGKAKPAKPAKAGKNGKKPKQQKKQEGKSADSGTENANFMSRKIGIVENIKIIGAADFAEKHGVTNRILEELNVILDKANRKTPKINDLNTAISRVREKLVKEGYYFAIFNAKEADIKKAGEKLYDPATKTLTLILDECRIGDYKIKFVPWDLKGAGESGSGEYEPRWFSKEQIERRFSGSVEKDRPFDYMQLRKALANVNAHPDLIVDTNILLITNRADSAEGVGAVRTRRTDIELTVREKFPLHGMVEVNNFGMEDIEEWQTVMSAQYMNLTKHDDVLTLSPSISFGAELKSIAGSYMLPHRWGLGGNTTLYGGWSDLDVDNIVPNLDLEGSGWFGGVQHSETLYEDDSHLWSISGGLLLRRIEDCYSAYSKKLNEREVTILPATLAVSYSDKSTDRFGGRNFVTLQGVYNVSTSGDRLSQMWTKADDHYWVARWQIARLQPVFGSYDSAKNKNLHQWMMFLKLEGQYTSDTLIPLEKLSLGGYNCLRGYKTRGYMGDWGLYGTAELRTPILLDAISSLFGGSLSDSDGNPDAVLDRLQFLGFVDYGWTKFNGLSQGYKDSEFLFSAGLGLRAALSKYFQLRLDLAFPLRDISYGDDDSMEVYFSAQMQF